MKKLIAIASVAACGAAIAVESANIVGYAQNSTINGNQGAGVCFLPISGEGTLGDLVIVGYDKSEGYADGQISCGKLDTYGRSTARYFWMDIPQFEDEGELYGPWYGWYDEEGETCYNNVSMSPGEAVWLKSPSTTFTLNWASPLE